MGASLYEPINVYKPVAPNIGTVDGPFEYLTVAGVKLPLPFTTRMTVARLARGDLFLHSPIRFDDRLADELQRLGTIRHLVSPNQFHYAHIGDWAKAFPEALTWASPRVREVIEAGAAGFVPKSYRLDEMEAALRVVLRHRVYLPAEFLLSHEATRAPAADANGDAVAREALPRFLRAELSPRQRQVLALSIRGVPVKLIARQLNIAESTVKAHLTAVYTALGVRNRTEAAYQASREGIRID